VPGIPTGTYEAVDRHVERPVQVRERGRLTVHELTHRYPGRRGREHVLQRVLIGTRL
jgi:hypothetical protein